MPVVDSPRMSVGEATAVAHPNLALVKYWGNRDHALRIPANGSISLTLGGLQTRTQVRFDSGLDRDQLTINDQPAEPAAQERVTGHLNLIRELAGKRVPALVSSQSDFPQEAGLASSAAAFAALTLAGCAAAGLKLDRRELSSLARRGSGSAARSLYGGFVELVAGEDHRSSFAQPLAPADHWKLIDLILLVSRESKVTGSTAGHAAADTSPLQAARVADAPRRLQECREAISTKDFARLTEVVEQDSDMMHAVMMTSTPALHYLQPLTLAVMASVRSLRALGVAACYTVDAGPNVHCLCLPEGEQSLRETLEGLSPNQEILRAMPGEAAWLV